MHPPDTKGSCDFSRWWRRTPNSGKSNPKKYMKKKLRLSFFYYKLFWAFHFINNVKRHIFLDNFFYKITFKKQRE